MEITDIIEGNKRYTGTIDKRLLKELAERGQKPAATIISCSDSRVPTEVIFDQLSPGNFFVIRIAGNIVADSSVKGSIEYAVTHLKTPYLIVLGHTECGAVKARLEGTATGEIGNLIKHIEIKSRELNQAIKENIYLQVNRVHEMECIKNAISSKTIEIHGMLYDLETGTVEHLTKN
ncbi:carbonic anhydrase [Chloroflexota bacterium]